MPPIRMNCLFGLLVSGEVDRVLALLSFTRLALQHRLCSSPSHVTGAWAVHPELWVLESLGYFPVRRVSRLSRFPVVSFPLGGILSVVSNLAPSWRSSLLNSYILDPLLWFLLKVFHPSQTPLPKPSSCLFWSRGPVTLHIPSPSHRPSLPDLVVQPLWELFA